MMLKDLIPGWDEVFLSIHEVPSDNIVESLYKMQKRVSDQLKTELAWYEQDVDQKNMPPSYQSLKTIVKKFLDQKMRARSFEARNERTVTRTPAKSRRKGKSVSVERKQEDCYHWRAKRKVYTKRRVLFPPR